MPQANAAAKRALRPAPKTRRKSARKPESRHTVGLAPEIVNRVERYAQTADTSMSKAIAALVSKVKRAANGSSSSG